MIATVIKYCGILLCCHYSFYKFLNIKIQHKITYLYNVLFSVVMSVGMYFLRPVAPYSSLLLMVLLSTIFLKFITHTKPVLSATTSAISFSYSYIIFSILIIISSFIFFLLNIPYSDNLYGYVIVAITIFMFCLVTLPFRLRRLKNGMPFLKNKGESDSGIIISFIILSCIILLSNNNNGNMIYSVFVILLIIFGALLYIWWRRQITKTYRRKMLEKQLVETKEELKKLKKNNDGLSELIHKDNKMIPAMQLIVKELAESYETLSGEELKEKKTKLIEQLDKISDERKGILKEYQKCNKVLPKTNVLSVDAMMNYMLKKAYNFDVNLDLCIFGSIKYMADNIINESDLTTLLSDLSENAIIATKNCKTKNIIVNLGIQNNEYFLQVIDSGADFDAKALLNIGKKRFTTHANDGGSGIGMMTTFKTLKKYNASLIIEEMRKTDNGFSKSITVNFDKKRQFIILSPRADKLLNIVLRDDVEIKNKIC